MKPLNILQASAGSGKTYRLALHYLTLLFGSEYRYREVLAVTFTNKATEEMKSRILTMLRGLAEGASAMDPVLSELLAAHPRLTAETLPPLADKIYRRILHDYSNFSVSTIDGFVQKVIRSFAFELGIDSGYTLEMNTIKVKRELTEMLYRQLDESPDVLQWLIGLALKQMDEGKGFDYHHALLSLSDEMFTDHFGPFDQALSALTMHEPLNDIFVRYKRLTLKMLRDFEGPLQQILAEIKRRLPYLDKEILKRKSLSPIYKLWEARQREIGKVMEATFFEALTEMIDRPDAWFQKGAVQDQTLYDTLNPLAKAFMIAYRGGVADYKLATAVNKNFDFLRLVKELWELLKKYRKENGVLLIGDAQALLKGITAGGEDSASFIWEKTGARYRYFLFDEFQDTSRDQWNNFRPILINAIASAPGTAAHHLIVGDAKQAIYRWRNGDWNILHSKVREEIGSRYIHEEALEANYRSHSTIIHFNNRLFAKAPDLLQRDVNALIEAEGSEQVKGWWTQKGYDQLLPHMYGNATQQHQIGTPAGGNVTVYLNKKGRDGSSDAAEAPDDPGAREPDHEETVGTFPPEVVREIHDLIGSGGYSFRDCAILVRTKGQGNFAVAALIAAGIPVISGESLLLANNAAVRLILYTLRAMADAGGTSGLFKAACVAIYRLLRGMEVDHACLAAIEKKSLDELGDYLPATLCGHWREWMHLPLVQLLETLIDGYGLGEVDDGTHIPFLLALRDLVGGFTREGDNGLNAFLTWWEEEGKERALPSTEGQDAVQVMTIHKSKGLAFRVVFIPYLMDRLRGKAASLFWIPAEGTPYDALGSLPLKYVQDLGKSTLATYYYEELLFNVTDAINLLYVATTRAKEKLVMSLSIGEKALEINKLTTVSDLLLRVIQETDEFASVISEDGGKMVYGSALGLGGLSRRTPQPDDHLFTLASYKTYERLTRLFSDASMQVETERLSRNMALREGTLLHDLLSVVEATEDVEPAIEAMQRKGYVREGEVAHFREKVLDVLRNPALRALLDESGEPFNERSIVSETGETYRPDKVLIRGSDVTIVDYKFTQKEEPAHERQIKVYENLLYQMGYAQVRGYLYYALAGTLKAVRT